VEKRNGELVEREVCRHCRYPIYRYANVAVDPSRSWYHFATAGKKCQLDTLAEPERESSSTDG
jgi:hypothetical protein